MRPKRREGDGLSRDQQRRLLVLSVGLAALLFVLVLGITAASHFYGNDPVDGQPDASFSVEPVERGDGVAANATHRGGDGLYPGDVVIEVDGERRGNWTSLGGEGLGVVAPGHSVVVTDVESGQEVRVVWIDDESGDRVLLGRNTIQSVSDG